jgi:hypothetical protein
MLHNFTFNLGGLLFKIGGFYLPFLVCGTFLVLSGALASLVLLLKVSISNMCTTLKDCSKTLRMYYGKFSDEICSCAINNELNHIEMIKFPKIV